MVFQEDGLEFSLMPVDLSVIEGLTGLLSCRSSNPSDTISWLKVKKKIN
jgi:hypothetical protein